ncbi:class I SAM-dependent methyltransferase [Amycolatopsis acidiphila]|uniref:Class I SAM-dependent methyltransferase n=1 Tax=Amycolatopsis acidiphila TaxID=715473 RepID=A0A558A5Z7_9PSEU|nr:class I SAM-dependent methyltransferase [Amycolatopsis acidiphila]TVT19693.1 class I SAM-dependent methyltransferase [Amycolatopsis acidiphila]UIJ61788.1 class I SAM-dependent methyltransferase [Amycolatopsis acidiphila]GHG57919.1 methyltransferase [Amycolatopsis acidiphila]
MSTAPASPSARPRAPGFLAHVLDRTFGRPRGLLGRIGGAVMACGNAGTERHVVDVAILTSGETVLVVGPGPGVGLMAASQQAGRVIGVDPSEEMLALCAARCPSAELRGGTADRTGQPDESVDVVLSVNNVQLWDDRAAGFAELRRVLRPGGRLVLSTHEKSLPVPRHELAAEVAAAGFTDLQTWTWNPPGPGTTAAELRAVSPS